MIATQTRTIVVILTAEDMRLAIAQSQPARARAMHDAFVLLNMPGRGPNQRPPTDPLFQMQHNPHFN